MYAGVLQIVPVKAFINPDYGLTRAEQFDRLMDSFDDSYNPSSIIGEWLEVKRAIKPDTAFTLDIHRPERTIWLKFFPQNREDGEYKITPRPKGVLKPGEQ